MYFLCQAWTQLKERTAHLQQAGVMLLLPCDLEAAN